MSSGLQPYVLDTQIKRVSELNSTPMFSTVGVEFTGRGGGQKHMCFVDLEKSFNLVHCGILWEVLHEYGVQSLLQRVWCTLPAVCQDCSQLILGSGMDNISAAEFEWDDNQHLDVWSHGSWPHRTCWRDYSLSTGLGTPCDPNGKVKGRVQREKSGFLYLDCREVQEH